MSKYVTTDVHGLPTGFFDSRFNTVPAGAQAVTDAQYALLMAAPLTTTFIGGTIGGYTPPAPTYTAPVQAQMALAAGLAITCTSHSAVSGTYALDSVTMEMANDLNALIVANSGAFPGSVSTWAWPDLSGTLHTIPNASTFQALWKALAAYRLALYSVIWGVTTTLPTASATIA